MRALSALIRIAHAALHEYCTGVAAPVLLDATAGNGHDTLVLARLAQPDGVVLAVDRQEEALKRTAVRLEDNGLTDRVRLIRGEHRDMVAILSHHLPSDSEGLAAAVFNLGFLPGGDKSLTTDADSTVAALDALWPLIRPGGLLCVHTYTGHPGAAEEAEAVARWMTLPWNDAQVTACSQFNKTACRETLFLVAKALLKSR